MSLGTRRLSAGPASNLQAHLAEACSGPGREGWVGGRRAGWKFRSGRPWGQAAA